MMTTMAALMGTLPIAIGVGAGSETRRPLGVAVVGGLFFSQFLTLYITPVVYTYLDSIQRWMGARRTGAVQPPATQPAWASGSGGRSPVAAADEGETEDDVQRLRRRAAS